jgi:TP901 family phage tail tape measure protein
LALDSNSIPFEIYFKDNLTNPLAQATNKGVASLNKLESAKGGLTKSSGGLRGSLGGVTGGLGAMLGPAALATTAMALVGTGLKQVISTGMDFTKVMSNVKALTGANTEQFKRLNDAAISLGASTSFSSSQVAEAMANAAAGGLEVNEIIEAMPGFLDLAASSNTDLARSVEIGMAQMNSFGLQAKDITHIVDMMSFTTVKSATGMEDLADGLNYIGSAAASLKVPLSEVLSIQATLGDRGLKGSMATRALSTALQKLSAPTKQMSETMQALNLDFFDSKGQFIGINNTIGLLETRMKGFTDEQKANTLSTLFGNEAFAEMTILLDKGSDGLKKLSNEIENSQGTAAKIAKTQLDNLTGDIEQFGGAWESLQLKMFSQGESGFRSLVQMATTFLNRLGRAWGDITEPLSEVASLFGDVWDVVKELLDAVGLLGGQFDLLGLYFKNIKWHLEVITTPLRLTLKLWIWLFKTIKEGVFVVQSFWDSLKNLAANIMKVFVPVGELLQGVFTLDWDQIKSGYSGLKSGLSSVFGDAGKTFSNSLNERRNRKGSSEETKDDTLTPLVGDTKNNQLMPPNAALNGSTKVNGGIDVVSSEKGSGKSVVVTINNLINSLTVQGANLQQNIKDAVAQALTDAVRDFETSYS